MSDIKMINGLVLGFLLGGAVGGVLGLFYAPKPGKQTRNDISRTSNELYENGKKKTYDSWNKAKDKAEDIIENVNNVISTNTEKIARKSDDLNEAFKSRIHAYKVDKDTNSLSVTEKMGKTDSQTS